MNNEHTKEIVLQTEAEENFAKYINFSLKNKKTILWITFVATVLSIAFALLQDKYYTAKVSMMEADLTNSGLSAFSNVSQGMSGLTSLIGGFEVEDNNTTMALAILESRTFIQKFIEENNILTILLSEDWNEETQSWIEEKDLYDGYMEFKDIISVEKDNKTNIFSISIEWKDPALSAEWANLLFKKLNHFMSEKDKLAAERNINYLESQLKLSSKVTIQNTLHAMIEQQTKTKMLASAQEEYAFELIDVAVVPKERSKPQRRLIVLAGFIIGLILSFSFIFIREYISYIKRIYLSNHK
tara:strand:- start:24 stop:920 length:897 start_codon:yes stop_codon:yes gene_type:complete